MQSKAKLTGKVTLVGAGPGDPGLVAWKAVRALESADIVIYDFLANPELLAHAKKAEHIYVGKRADQHTLPQQEINQLLVDKAKTGQHVVRLKGGDPFVFGRGGEEALMLKKHEIPFEIIPGVTAGIAAAAYAGIPVTHRGLATSVSLITGHEDPTKESSQLDWQALANLQGTLVFYMGMRQLPHIVEQLQRYGKSGDTPVAVVSHGTSPRQKSVTATMKHIVEQVKQNRLEAPAVIIVGPVVTLKNKLDWYEKLSLLGKRIVVTRSRAQASELAQQLTDLGAEVITFPTIKIVAPDSWHPVDQAINRLHTYQWIVFTSVNGVDAFFQRMTLLNKDTRALAACQIAAIGPATADRLARYGIKADLMPEKFVAEEVLASLGGLDLAGKNFLLPRTDIARDTLINGLQDMGAHVDQIIVYRTVIESDHDPDTLQTIKNGDFDLVTFTSSSTVTNFVNQFDGQALPDCSAACIGPITEKTARKHGFKVKIIPEHYTIPSLVNAIVEQAEKEKQSEMIMPNKRISS